MPEKQLTPKQQRFVDEYLIDLNASAAYRRAGYKVKSVTVASVESHRLLSNPIIAKMIAEKIKQLAERAELTQDDVIQGLLSETKKGIGSHPLARVRAWQLIGQHLGMFEKIHKHKHGGDKDAPPIKIDVKQFDKLTPQDMEYLRGLRERLTGSLVPSAN